MLLKNKIWTRLYILKFLLVFTVILRSVFLQDYNFSTNTKNGTRTYIKTIFSKNVSRIELLISGIANVSAMEPPEEVSDKCQPADLTPIEKLNCSHHPGLSGRTWTHFGIDSIIWYLDSIETYCFLRYVQQ